MKKGRFTSIFVAVSLVLAASTAFALDNLPSKTGLSVSVGGEYLGFKVKAYGEPEGTDVGATGVYVGGEYAARSGKILYAAGLDIGGALIKVENAMENNEHFSGATPYGRATLKGAYALTDTLKIGATASYLYAHKATDEISGQDYGVNWKEKLKIGPVSVITFNAPTVQFAVKGLEIFAGYSMQIVDMAKAKATFSADGFGGYEDYANLNPINTSGAILGVIYSLGKYEIGLQGALRANNASAVNGAVTYRF